MKDKSLRIKLDPEIAKQGGWICTANFRWHRIDIKLPAVLEQQFVNVLTNEFEWRTIPIHDDF